ncbi:LytR family transcriptional regulator, partial [bacterium]|nr:LytR family transcriptional regulator [bacterium]
IDYTMVTEDVVNGLDVLRPIPDQIRLVRDQMFAQPGTAAAPIELGTSDALSLAKTENATVEVLNGTSTSGLADATASYLQSQGLSNVTTGNSDQAYDYTTIVLHNDKPYTMAYLAQLMQIPNTRIMRKLDAGSSVDITLYVGYDWANNNPMP